MKGLEQINVLALANQYTGPDWDTSKGLRVLKLILGFYSSKMINLEQDKWDFWDLKRKDELRWDGKKITGVGIIVVKTIACFVCPQNKARLPVNWLETDEVVFRGLLSSVWHD